MKQRHKLMVCSCLLSGVLFVSGCVDQKAARVAETAPQGIVATSVAVAEICDKLEIDLIGIPSSSVSSLPSRYAEATVIGSPMSPDMEILTELSPSWVLSPSSLMDDLKTKYENAGLQYAFLNLKSVTGMYKSIEQLGALFDCEQQATELVTQFEEFYIAYQERNGEKESPTVLLLMGLPGSYVVATEHSYAGSLVKLAGGVNVYQEQSEFLHVNTEDMLAKNPDIILRTAHALPEEVMEMFAEEFVSNDIWKHFEAVQQDRVYDLPTACFGMSANFSYPEALEMLETIFYQEDTF